MQSALQGYIRCLGVVQGCVTTDEQIVLSEVEALPSLGFQVFIQASIDCLLPAWVSDPVYAVRGDLVERLNAIVEPETLLDGNLGDNCLLRPPFTQRVYLALKLVDYRLFVIGRHWLPGLKVGFLQMEHSEAQVLRFFAVRQIQLVLSSCGDVLNDPANTLLADLGNGGEVLAAGRFG